MRIAGSLLLVPALVVALSGVAAAGETGPGFAEAQAQARERGVPMLVDFFTDWCVYCKHFDADRAKPESGLAEALEKVVFVQVDAEKGEGIELRQKYEVAGFPTYVLMDAEGEVIDRWSGYGGPEHFLTTYEPALEDPTPLVRKRERFAKNPNAADAQVLARIAMGSGKYDDALGLYEQAEELDPSLSFASERFWSGYYSLRSGGAVDVARFRDMGEAMLALEGLDLSELAGVAQVMTRVAAKEEADFHRPFVEKAMARADEMEGPMRTATQILGALHVDGDKARAAELKKSTMPEGWMDDADALNAYAWWSFENEVNLEEAEALARKGIELAEPGKQKAMILDTAAEICNARGDCRDAVTLIEQAIENDPDSEGYKQQLERFRKILASQ